MRANGCTTWLLPFAGLPAVLCSLVLSPFPAAAAPLSDCTPQRGTIVAVDFAHWGGPIVRGCGINEPSGYALLHAAGFTTGGDAHDGSAFVCRLGNPAFRGGTLYPTPSEERCAATPSTSAYWSYWLAPAGHSTWTYSPLGPMGDVPKPGEVELWTFGATNVSGTRGSAVPNFSPNTLRATNPAPPRHTTPPRTTTAPTTATATRPSSRPVPPATSAHRSGANRPAASGHRQPRSRARKPASGAALRPAAHTAAVVPAQPADERTSPGSASPLVVSLCLALALVVSAGWAVRRRRRYE